MNDLICEKDNIKDIFPNNIEKNQNTIMQLKKKFKSQFIEEPSFYLITPLQYIIKQNYIECDFYNMIINSEDSIITGFCQTNLLKNQIIIENTSIKYEKLVFDNNKNEKFLKLEDNSNYDNTLKYTIKTWIKLNKNENLDKSIKIMIDVNEENFENFNSCFTLFNSLLQIIIKIYEIKLNFDDLININKNYANIFFPKINYKILLCLLNTLYKSEINKITIYDKIRDEIFYENINEELGFIKLILSRKNSNFQNNNLLNKLFYELKVAFKLLNFDEIEDFNFIELKKIEDLDIKDNLRKQEIDDLIEIDSFFLIKNIEYSNEFFKFNFIFNIKKTANFFYELFKNLNQKDIMNFSDLISFYKNLTDIEFNYNFLDSKEINHLKNILGNYSNLINGYSFFGDDIYDNLIIICKLEHIKTIQSNIMDKYLNQKEDMIILNSFEKMSSINSFVKGINFFNPINSFWL